jgi:hypothetical protein
MDENPAMAILTTVDGIQITFAAKTVSMLADHDANTGLAVTCVYGVTKEALQIRESVQEFLTRLRITNNFAQLTRPNGFPIWINGSEVSSIRAPLSNEFVKGVNTVVFTDDFMQGVKELPDDVVAAINEHGGDL